MTPEQEIREKVAFAEALLRSPDDPFQAALTVYPTNTSRALWVSIHWRNDSIVATHMERQKAEYGEMYGLPDKREALLAIWQQMEAAKNDRDQIAFARLMHLYLQTRGYIERPAAPTNINVSVPRAIEVPTHQSDEHWEQEAASQQAELLAISRQRH